MFDRSLLVSQLVEMQLIYELYKQLATMNSRRSRVADIIRCQELAKTFLRVDQAGQVLA